MLICVDLDGTLLDTVPANAASYRAALEELGFTVTDEYYAERCNGDAVGTKPVMWGTTATKMQTRSSRRCENISALLSRQDVLELEWEPRLCCLRSKCKVAQRKSRRGWTRRSGPVHDGMKSHKGAGPSAELVRRPSGEVSGIPARIPSLEKQVQQQGATFSRRPSAEREDHAAWSTTSSGEINQHSMRRLATGESGGRPSTVDSKSSGAALRYGQQY